MGNLHLKNLLICCSIILFGSNLAFACSGEFAEQAIRGNERVAFTFGVIGVVIFLAIVTLYFLRHKKGLPTVIVSGLILALHPGWTNGAWIGGCGTSVVSGAKYFTAALIIGLIIQSLLYFRNCSAKKLILK
jgi:predicted MFS family arabinose efflux permease